MSSRVALCLRSTDTCVHEQVAGDAIRQKPLLRPMFTYERAQKAFPCHRGASCIGAAPGALENQASEFTREAFAVFCARVFAFPFFVSLGLFAFLCLLLSSVSFLLSVFIWDTNDYVNTLPAGSAEWRQVATFISRVPNTRNWNVPREPNTSFACPTIHELPVRMLGESGLSRELFNNFLLLRWTNGQFGARSFVTKV